MFVNKVLYDIEDFTVVPAIQSYIDSRTECNPYYAINGKKYLPIFVSPMECVINRHNFDIYDTNHVIPILPRTEKTALRLDYAKDGKWIALSLNQFKQYFCDADKPFVADANDMGVTIRVLIDQANGHMAQLPKVIKKSKDIAKQYNFTLELMVGNIANPETYRVVAEAGADYARLAVGNGNCCITASNTAQNYPLGSLILDSKVLKTKYDLKCAIVADGGISSYRRAIIAYALGADYVMIGSTFGRCFESASSFLSVDRPAKMYTGYNLEEINEMRWNTEITESDKKEIIKLYTPMTKAVWGMSTRRAQISIALAEGKKKENIRTKTSEGVEKIVTVDYTLHQWLENFTDYLCSSMSYDNITDVKNYIGEPLVYLVSARAQGAINK